MRRKWGKGVEATTDEMCGKNFLDKFRENAAVERR